MTINRKTTIFAAFLATGLIYLAGCGESEKDTAQAGQKRGYSSASSWEYAELRMHAWRPGRLQFEGPDNVEEVKKSYNKDGKSDGIKIYVEMGNKLNLKVRRNDSTALLNALAEEGWEVLDHEMFGIEYQVDCWTLRRQK